MAMACAVFYLIPGLGANELAFQFLRLHGEVNVLRWLPPLSFSESLEHYAARLAAAVPVEQVCWLVGISFGGILALEAVQLRPLARVVLISSFSGPRELPWPGRSVRSTGLYYLLPPQLLPRLPRVAKWFFSVKNGREYELLCQIRHDIDSNFTRWATGCCSGRAGPLQQPSASTAPPTGCCPSEPRSASIGCRVDTSSSSATPSKSVVF